MRGTGVGANRTAKGVKPTCCETAPVPSAAPLGSHFQPRRVLTDARSNDGPFERSRGSGAGRRPRRLRTAGGATQTMAYAVARSVLRDPVDGGGRGAAGLHAGVSTPGRSAGSGRRSRVAAPHRHHAALNMRRARRHDVSAAGRGAGRAGAGRGRDPLVGGAAAAAGGGAADALTRGASAVRPPLPRAVEHGAARGAAGVDEAACGSGCSVFATSCARRLR